MALASGSMLLLSLEQGGLASGILGLAPLRFFGRYSYGIYVYSVLIHDWLGLHLKPIAYRIPQQTVAGVVYLLVCIAIVIAIAMASFYGCERPFLRLKRHFK
jgi:peptidoglycan/LPS O-acetylase OafA/YrhL